MLPHSIMQLMTIHPRSRTYPYLRVHITNCPGLMPQAKHTDSAIQCHKVLTESVPKHNSTITTLKPTSNSSPRLQKITDSDRRLKRLSFDPPYGIQPFPCLDRRHAFAIVRPLLPSFAVKSPTPQAVLTHTKLQHKTLTIYISSKSPTTHEASQSMIRLLHSPDSVQCKPHAVIPGSTHLQPSSNKEKKAAGISIREAPFHLTSALFKPRSSPFQRHGIGP